ncbi:MAG: diadenylate cyclase CdaA [Oscillospiraceae bacterium]|nr:diadenylate cyclase CdaA [Oscillospiraceae bacterium]
MLNFFKQVQEAVIAMANTFSWRDALDILLVAYLIYKLVGMLAHTRTGALVKGMIVLAAAYAVSTALQLKTIKFVIDYLFRYGLVVLVVIFQPELRSMLERVGRARFGRSLFTIRLDEQNINSLQSAYEMICSAAADMSRTMTGALIVFEKDTPLTEIIATGSVIDAEISEELIENIFYKGSPLHDGAVIVRGDRITAAGCLLPVSHNTEISKEMGTRHRAGIGITEVTDALSLIVSEENGFISIAQNGVIIRNLDKAGTLRILERELMPREKEDDDKQKFSFKRLIK